MRTPVSGVAEQLSHWTTPDHAVPGEAGLSVTEINS